MIEVSQPSHLMEVMEVKRTSTTKHIKTK